MGTSSVVFPSPMHGYRRIDARDSTGDVYAYLQRDGSLEVAAYGCYFSWGYFPTYYHGDEALRRALRAGITKEQLSRLCRES